MIARLCPHGRFNSHNTKDGEHVVLTPDQWGRLLFGAGEYEVCPGGSLLPSDSLVIVKEDGEWPEWAQRAVSPWLEVDADGAPTGLRMKAPDKLDALAAAQPGRE